MLSTRAAIPGGYTESLLLTRGGSEKCVYAVIGKVDFPPREICPFRASIGNVLSDPENPQAYQQTTHTMMN